MSMNRLTIDKPVEEMGMRELAHNSCYAKDRQAFYRDYDKEVDARELAKNLVEAYDADYEYTGDMEQFEEELFDSLQYGLNDITGLIAFIYRQLWAQADLYERLKEYEGTEITPEQIREIDKLYLEKCQEVNKLKAESLTGLEMAQIYATLNHYKKLEEQGRLIELPCKVGDAVYEIFDGEICEYKSHEITFDSYNKRFCYDSLDINLDDIGKNIFITREEAEQALKESEKSEMSL